MRSEFKVRRFSKTRRWKKLSACESLLGATGLAGVLHWVCPQREEEVTANVAAEPPSADAASARAERKEGFNAAAFGPALLPSEENVGFGAAAGGALRKSWPPAHHGPPRATSVAKLKLVPAHDNMIAAASQRVARAIETPAVRSARPWITEAVEKGAAFAARHGLTAVLPEAGGNVFVNGLKWTGLAALGIGGTPVLSAVASTAGLLGSCGTEGGAASCEQIERPPHVPQVPLERTLINGDASGSGPQGPDAHVQTLYGFPLTPNDKRNASGAAFDVPSASDSSVDRRLRQLSLGDSQRASNKQDEESVEIPLAKALHRTKQGIYFVPLHAGLNIPDDPPDRIEDAPASFQELMRRYEQLPEIPAEDILGEEISHGLNGSVHKNKLIEEEVIKIPKTETADFKTTYGQFFSFVQEAVASERMLLIDPDGAVKTYGITKLRYNGAVIPGLRSERFDNSFNTKVEMFRMLRDRYPSAQHQTHDFWRGMNERYVESLKHLSWQSLTRQYYNSAKYGYVVRDIQHLSKLDTGHTKLFDMKGFTPIDNRQTYIYYLNNLTFCNEVGKRVGEPAIEPLEFSALSFRTWWPGALDAARNEPPSNDVEAAQPALRTRRITRH